MDADVDADADADEAFAMFTVEEAGIPYVVFVG